MWGDYGPPPVMATAAVEENLPAPPSLSAREVLEMGAPASMEHLEVREMGDLPWI